MAGYSKTSLAPKLGLKAGMTAVILNAPTDLDGNSVREMGGLANGPVDVKVAAVDEVWSGLKFVYRLTDR